MSEKRIADVGFVLLDKGSKGSGVTGFSAATGKPLLGPISSAEVFDSMPNEAMLKKHELIVGKLVLMELQDEVVETKVETPAPTEKKPSKKLLSTPKPKGSKKKK